MTDEQRGRWKRLAGMCDIFLAAVAVAGCLLIGAGVSLYFTGTLTSDGSYLSDGVVYQVRQLGILLAGLGVLFAPTLGLFVRFLQVYAQGQVES